VGEPRVNTWQSTALPPVRSRRHACMPIHVQWRYAHACLHAWHATVATHAQRGSVHVASMRWRFVLVSRPVATSSSRCACLAPTSQPYRPHWCQGSALLVHALWWPGWTLVVRMSVSFVTVWGWRHMSWPGPMMGVHFFFFSSARARPHSHYHDEQAPHHLHETAQMSYSSHE
jgi:hypothetical protein